MGCYECGYGFGWYVSGWLGTLFGFAGCGLRLDALMFAFMLSVAVEFGVCYTGLYLLGFGVAADSLGVLWVLFGLCERFWLIVFLF